MSGDAFQLFFHPKLGVVIYDPVAQMGLAREQMRLFKVGAMGASTFVRDIVSKDLGACGDEQSRRDAAAVELSHGAHRPSQAVLRALPSSLRLCGFHCLRGLQRDPLHLRYLQLRLPLASS